MKNLFLSLFIITLLTPDFGRASEISKIVLSPKLQLLSFEVSTPSDVEKLLGKPKETEKKNDELIYFYNLNGVDYDTTVSFRKNKLHYLIVSNTHLKFSDFKKYFTEKDLKKSAQEMSQQTGHEKGRYFKITHVQGGFQGRFSNSQQKQLIEATLWKEGRPAP